MPLLQLGPQMLHRFRFRTFAWITSLLALQLAIPLGGAFAEDDRFDYKVREDLFEGFAGDRKALDRGMKTCEEVLKEDPKHAEAMVWRGAGRMFLAGQAFSKQDQAGGAKLFAQALKDLDEAAELAPDNIAVLIPRAAVLLPAARDSPAFVAAPLLARVEGDFEKIYKRQKNMLDQLGEHPRGELQMGLADVYRLLGKMDKSKAQLEAVVKEMPDTEYATRASEWLKAGPKKRLAHNCIGCHDG